MKVSIQEHMVPKNTAWGPVQRSLGQHIVFLEVDGVKKQCGYIGKTAFLPLSGFPRELVGEVTKQCSKLVGRDLTGSPPPPSMAELATIIENLTPSEDDDE